MYDEGSNATITVSNTVTESNTAKYVFKGWVDEHGELLSKQPTYSFIVNRPMIIRPKWNKEYSSTFPLIVIILVAAVILALILIRLKIKKS
ncbi:MAG: hypothetical protein J7K23_07220 [Thermoproteales archaeon]|nr:hypothetical protein [Thermoproteales archaeon]